MHKLHAAVKNANGLTTPNCRNTVQLNEMATVNYACNNYCRAFKQLKLNKEMKVFKFRTEKKIMERTHEGRSCSFVCDLETYGRVSAVGQIHKFFKQI